MHGRAELPPGMTQERQIHPPATVLLDALSAGASAAGGWAYYAGKASRIEPTCWALLALDGDRSAATPHRRFLLECQRANGWLVEDPAWPVNVGFNALTTFTWFAIPALATDAARERVLDALLTQKGVQAPPMEGSTQDNSLQGWSWVDTTFSWVEPTAWGVLALNAAVRAGVKSPAIDARISEAERLLLNRTCRDGGWNFGNASMLGQDLRPYVPITALVLLALQRRREDPAVQRSVAFLESHWPEEISATALGLSLIALAAFGRPIAAIEARLRQHAASAVAFGNFHGVAVSLLALSDAQRSHVFRF